MAMICANPDIVVERGERLVYCAGAIADLYAASGGSVLYAGKPYRPIYEQALGVASKRRGRETAPQRVLAIGDSVRTDLKGAAAFGIDAVLLDPRCADPLYRRSVRVSMGHALQVPFAVLPGPWPDSLDVLSGVTTLALTPSGPTALRDVTPPERWAVLLGAEGAGLSGPALARAQLRVRIPMAPGVDSLNVATAAAVAFAHLSG